MLHLWYTFQKQTKNVPPIDLYRNCTKKHKKCTHGVFLVHFLSHKSKFHRCMQGIRNPESAPKTHWKQVKNALCNIQYKCYCIYIVAYQYIDAVAALVLLFSPTNPASNTLPVQGDNTRLLYCTVFFED